MDHLKTASFGALFTSTFLVAAASQVVFSLLAIVMAFLSPSIFNMNGAPATNPGQAIGVVLFMLTFGLFVNAGMSALGSACWLGLRRWRMG